MAARKAKVVKAPASYLRGKVFAALTGMAADVSGSPDGDLRGMLLAVGGTSSKTRSGIDLTAAAAKLQVSRGTVERWVKTAQSGTGQRPSATHLKDLAKRARQAATTKAGRKAIRAGSNLSQAIASRGARLTITGYQGPVDSGKDYLRDRTTVMVLDPADAEAMMDAWEAGGEKGFISWATDYWQAEYVPGWQFGDPAKGGGDLTEFKIEHPHGGDWQ
jgi:transposase-like protein